MTSGKKSSTNFTVTDTVGQTGSGRYTSNGFIIKSGFQYIYPLNPFTFSISTTSISFGTLTSQSPVTQTATLTITTDTAYGYQVTTIEDNQLDTSTAATIADTACDSGPCTVSTAAPWTSSSTYGFGYNMTGTDIPATFTDSTYYRPFPSEADGGSPAIVMSDTNVGTNQQATITFKINVGPVQEAGQYNNIVKFVATPRY